MLSPEVNCCLCFLAEEREINPVHYIECDKRQRKENSGCFVKRISSSSSFVSAKKVRNSRIIYHRFVYFARQVNHFKVVNFETCTRGFDGTIVLGGWLVRPFVSFETNGSFYGRANSSWERAFVDLKVQTKEEGHFLTLKLYELGTTLDGTQCPGF